MSASTKVAMKDYLPFLKPSWSRKGSDCLTKDAKSSGTSNGGTSYIRYKRDRLVSVKAFSFFKTAMTSWQLSKMRKLYVMRNSMK